MKMNYEDIENRVFVKKYELKNLTPSNIKNFIKDNLFEEQEPLNIVYNKFNIEDSTSFEPILYINSKEYRISKAVRKEIYNSLRFLIEEINSLDPWDRNIIEANLDARFTIVEKIEYLKEKRKELYLGIQNEPEYYVYTGKREFNGFDNWEDLIFDMLLYDQIIATKYLTNDLDIPDIPKNIYNDWHKYYKTKELIDICENKINDLSEGKESGNEEIEFKNPSLPKAIAMLYEVGFFELEKIKKLTPKAIIQIIATIQVKDPNNPTVKRAIGGNLRVLDPDSLEDNSKYTTHKNLEKIKSLYNEIKKGNY